MAKRLSGSAFAPRGTPAVMVVSIPPRHEPHGDPRQPAHASPAGRAARRTFATVPTLTRLTALALARAMLAGSPSPAGLAARMRACLDADAGWYQALADRCARLPGERWRRLTHRTLVRLIEEDPGYRQAWSTASPPRVRRYLLRERAGMQAPPLGLDICQLPPWPHAGALAEWLGLSEGGIWRLTRPPGWQRRQSRGDQHYRYRLLAKRRGGCQFELRQL